MKLYYYRDRKGNFGDDLNPWLWSRLIPGFLDDDESELFIGIGTILNNRIPALPRKVVFGSGLGYGSAPPNIDDKWHFYCVRGPLTARSLKLPDRYAITDPAALIATLEFASDVKDGPALIPHHVSARNANWEKICKRLGIRYIDPRSSVDHVIQEITKSTFVITEAMHGAIFADSLRIPWCPVIFYDHILKSKWLDWCLSLDVAHEHIHIPGIWDEDYNYDALSRMKILIKRTFLGMGYASDDWTAPPKKSTRREVDKFCRTVSSVIDNPRVYLSKDTIFSSRLSQLQDKLNELKCHQFGHQ